MGGKPKKAQGWTRMIVRILLAGVIGLTVWLTTMRFRSHANTRPSLRYIKNSEVSSVVLTSAALKSDVCHVEENTEFEGNLLKDGAVNLKDSAPECCASCQSTPNCNAWVWCGQPGGCGPDRGYRQCWLKQQVNLNMLYVRGMRDSTLPWTSGAVFSNQELEAARASEAKRLDGLVQDTSLPIVFLDVAIKGKLIGQIKMVLFTRESPRAAENFRALCTGEKGIVAPGKEGAGQPYHFKGKPFYRIIDRFIDQTGAGTESVFGGWFKDDAGGLQLKHDRRGLLSMANSGPDTNSSHFSIMMGPAPHLNGHYTIFGEVVSGFEVIEAINMLSRGQPNNFAGPDAGAIIVDAGQIRCGTPCGTPELYKEASSSKHA